MDDFLSAVTNKWDMIVKFKFINDYSQKFNGVTFPY